jgi:hypothetical protein
MTLHLRIVPKKKYNIINLRKTLVIMYTAYGVRSLHSCYDTAVTLFGVPFPLNVSETVVWVYFLGRDWVCLRWISLDIGIFPERHRIGRTYWAKKLAWTWALACSYIMNCPPSPPPISFLIWMCCVQLSVVVRSTKRYALVDKIRLSCDMPSMDRRERRCGSPHSLYYHLHIIQYDNINTIRHNL